MKRILFFLTILVCSICCFPVMLSAELSQDLGSIYLEHAIEYWDGGDYTSASLFARSSIEYNPLVSDPYFILAMKDYQQQSMGQQVEELLIEALYQDNFSHYQRAQAVILLAGLWNRFGKHNQVLELVDQELPKISLHSTEAYREKLSVQKIKSLLFLGEKNAAAGELEEWLEIYPESRNLNVLKSELQSFMEPGEYLHDFSDSFGLLYDKEIIAAEYADAKSNGAVSAQLFDRMLYVGMLEEALEEIMLLPAQLAIPFAQKLLEKEISAEVRNLLENLKKDHNGPTLWDQNNDGFYEGQVGILNGDVAYVSVDLDQNGEAEVVQEFFENVPVNIEYTIDSIRYSVEYAKYPEVKSISIQENGIATSYCLKSDGFSLDVDLLIWENGTFSGIRYGSRLPQFERRVLRQMSYQITNTAVDAISQMVIPSTTIFLKNDMPEKVEIDFSRSSDGFFTILFSQGRPVELLADTDLDGNIDSKTIFADGIKKMSYILYESSLPNDAKEGFAASYEDNKVVWVAENHEIELSSGTRVLEWSIDYLFEIYRSILGDE